MSFEPIRIGNTVIRRSSSSSSSSSSSKYEIKNEASPFLIKSIGDAKATSTTMTIEATEVLTMRSYLKRVRHVTELYVALNLVHNLGKQMQSLISAGRSIACIGVDDVVVITHRDSDTFTHESINDVDSTLDDNRADPQFLFLNDHLIFELDDDGALIIDHALKTKGKGKDKSKSKYAFMSPELQHLSNDAPNAPHAPPTHATHAPPHATKSVHFKTVYYSAAQLVIYFLLNVDRIPDDNAYMDPIKHTKLYWFLLRCLNPVPAERKYIYI